MATDWVDPSVDEVAHVFGYPADRHIVVGDQLVSQSRREVTVAIRPDIFSGKVMSGPSFPTNDFIPDQSLGDNAFNNLFSAIVVQRMQGFAPAREVATQELGLVARRVFLVLGVVDLQNEFTLFYESIYSFCVLH
jgi:hypothetical protein